MWDLHFSRRAARNHGNYQNRLPAPPNRYRYADAEDSAEFNRQVAFKTPAAKYNISSLRLSLAVKNRTEERFYSHGYLLVLP